MWFIFTICTILAWSGSDLFSKIGSRPDDKHSHLKMLMAVGLVMGIHAIWQVTIGGVEYSLFNFIAYMPVSAMYIISMMFGYIGLRYIELSISSPICNSSGALVAIMCFVFLGDTMSPLALLAVTLISVGIIGDRAERALRAASAAVVARFGVDDDLPVLDVRHLDGAGALDAAFFTAAAFIEVDGGNALPDHAQIVEIGLHTVVGAAPDRDFEFVRERNAAHLLVKTLVHLLGERERIDQPVLAGRTLAGDDGTHPFARSARGQPALRQKVDERLRCG